MNRGATSVGAPLSFSGPLALLLQLDKPYEMSYFLFGESEPTGFEKRGKSCDAFFLSCFSYSWCGEALGSFPGRSVGHSVPGSTMLSATSPSNRETVCAFCPERPSLLTGHTISRSTESFLPRAQRRIPLSLPLTLWPILPAGEGCASMVRVVPAAGWPIARSRTVLPQVFGRIPIASAGEPISPIPPRAFPTASLPMTRLDISEVEFTAILRFLPSRIAPSREILEMGGGR